MAHDISIDETQFNTMIQLLASSAKDLFLSPACRQYFAKDTFEKRGSPVREFTGPSAGAMPGTIAHNRIQIDDGTFTSAPRTLRLINPLSSIHDVFTGAVNMKVLSIGPRTEMELLHLVGIGFLPGNITGLDLISTSPWIDLGDMHAMPYPDTAFDVVISGWVLAYSKNPQKAVDEMLRVVKPGGIVAIGVTYNPDAAEIEYKNEGDRIQGRIFRRVAELTAMIGPRLGPIYFQHEPEADEKLPVMLIARIR
ncbi:MAG: class I SAM-dependent methyltransferase [Rhodospirillaceae bacterium]|nr:class I SAM-dependent methyltransferase [Rhodospirillaceae bacterium]